MVRSMGCLLPGADSREAALLSIALGGKYSSLRMGSRETDASLLLRGEKIYLSNLLKVGRDSPDF